MPHADPAVRRAYGREWIKRNAAKAREAMSRWRKAHREEDRANKRDYYARNRERSKAAVAAYRLANPRLSALSDVCGGAEKARQSAYIQRRRGLTSSGRTSGRGAYSAP